jgi:hypothetical protein
MSLRRVTADTFVAWDGGWQPVQAGTIVDVPPGSVLEAVYGLSNLEDLSDPVPRRLPRPVPARRTDRETHAHSHS